MTLSLDLESAWGIYLHIPWCRRRCPYCAFYVEVDRDVPWQAFSDAVQREYELRKSGFELLESRSFPKPPTTLFFGGGTPSRTPVPYLASWIQSFQPAATAEITMEVNPEDVEDDWLVAVKEAGVTRISLGMQTFNPQFSRLLNRACTIDIAEKIARQVSETAFQSWSVDLIFGLPGQILADLDADLERIFDLDAPHVSIYGLTIEPNTPFERAVKTGKLHPLDDHHWRTYYDHIVKRLAIHGLYRYEVSNFSKPGHESRHNRLYWQDAPYLGLGPSAHGLAPNGIRWRNIADVAKYITGSDPTLEYEPADREARALDLLIAGLRCRDGVDLERLHQRYGYTLDTTAVTPHLNANTIIQTKTRLVLTEAGFPLADGITEKLSRGLIPWRPQEANSTTIG